MKLMPPPQAPPPLLSRSTFFPPRPIHLKGRRHELDTLVATLRRAPATPTVLLGAGGSGKSLLACALGYRLASSVAHSRFWGGIHWFRVGAWDHHTLLEMLALRFRTGRNEMIPALRAHLNRRGRSLIVLDNHDNDRAMSRFLEALRGCPVTWVLTARRCLLTGVSLFPVIAPLVTSARQAFPAVAGLTKLLRWNPLALNIADALVKSRAAPVTGLRTWLVERGVERVSVMADEDDIAEVRLLVEWAWPRLDPDARRLMAVLAHVGGDHVDVQSLHGLARHGLARHALARQVLARQTLTRTRSGGRGRGGLSLLRRWQLVQEPLPDRFALHAVVRRAVAGRTRFPARRFFDHYLRLLERQPDRLELEQSHLFAAMDHAHDTSDMGGLLRVERLLNRMAG